MKDPEVIPPPERVSITNLLGGGIIEMVDDELQRVADNILDPNTKETAVRTVVLKITIKPDVDRSIAATAIDVQSKLAPVRPQATRIFVSQQRGKGVLVEHDPKQQRLPGVDVSKPKAVG
jgi:hypothetical protein